MVAVIAAAAWRLNKLLWFSADLRSRLAKERAALARLESGNSPALTELSVIERELADANRVREELFHSFRGGGATLAGLDDVAVPQGRTEAFFDLASFVERTREKVVRAGVAVSQREYFGFAEFEREGPEVELIAITFRQRLILERILDLLLQARPLRLIEVRRSHSSASAQSSAGQVGSARRDDGARPPGAGRAALELFSDPALAKQRIPVAANTLEFRISFAGDTGSLRAFVNGLCDLRWPLVLQSVLVEPESKPGVDRRTMSGAAQFADERSVIVRRTVSKFTVALGFVELPVAEVAAVPSLQPAPAWPVPKAQSAGDQWIFDLFTPPEIYYDDFSREFTVIPPDTEKRRRMDLDAAPETRPRDPDPVPLRLAGFIGADGNYLGILEDTRTTEHSLVRRGDRWMERDLTIVAFNVERVRAQANDDMATTELVATARVREDLTGMEYVLTTVGGFDRTEVGSVEIMDSPSAPPCREESPAAGFVSVSTPPEAIDGDSEMAEELR